MRNESEIPFADNPFSIPVADRLKRLPPYLFGKINKMKYQKRVAGIDVIGEWLTEINVTSPTGIVAIEKFDGTDVAGLIWDAIEAKVAAKA